MAKEVYAFGKTPMKMAKAQCCTYHKLLAKWKCPW